MSAPLASPRTARPWRAVLAGVLAAGAITTGMAPAAESSVDVIVSARGEVAPVLDDIARLGGEVTAVHAAVGTVMARLAPSQLAALRADRDVALVAQDHAVDFANTDADSKARATTGKVTQQTLGVDKFLSRGFDGSGIDIAVIDTGIADHEALEDRVVEGIDLSFDAGTDAANDDLYGHGTHLAGLMVGEHKALKPVAGGARLVDVRVGDRNGAADVSQVIAAIDWVIQNARTDGRNIRVINLAFGTPSTQDYRVDPLTNAVEAAWRNGIVVVVSAGNGGEATTSLANPATHPLVIAVGAADSAGTATRDDDRVASFSQTGSRSRGVDIVAPGRSMLSVLPEDSWVARNHPEAREGELWRGSGTSQAAAVVSASVALLLQVNPDWTPDQVKAALMGSSTDVAEGTLRDGAGQPWLPNAARTRSRAVAQAFDHAKGTGSLEASRGGQHVKLRMKDGSTMLLEGEVDFTGAEWTGTAWGSDQWNGSHWNGSHWNGSHWNGSHWNGSHWNGSHWNGSHWNGSHWNGSHWNAAIWGD